MKVQSKFILMSTAALFAIISSASAVEVPGLREVNGLRAQLDRKFRKLDKTQEQLLIEELYNDRPTSYDDRKDRKEAKTFEEVRVLCEQLKAAIETHGLVRYAKKECGKTQPSNLAQAESEVAEAPEATPAPSTEDRTNIVTINGVDYVVEMGSSGQSTGNQGGGSISTGNQGANSVSTEIAVTGTGNQGNNGNNPGNNPGPTDPVTPVTPVVVSPPVTPPPVTPVVRKTPVKAPAKAAAKKKKSVQKTSRIVSEPAKKQPAKKPAKRILSEPKKEAPRAPVTAVKLPAAPVVTFNTAPSVDTLRMLNISAAPAAPEKDVKLKAKSSKFAKKSSKVKVDGEKDADDMKAKSDEMSWKRSKFKGTVPESIKDIIIAKQAKEGLTAKDISNLKTKNFGAIRAEADSVHMNLKRTSSTVSAN